MVRRGRRVAAVRTVVTTTRRRRRTRQRRPRQKQETVTERALVTVPPPKQRIIPRGVSRRPIMRLSKEGLAFLKCAFASPDFDVDPGMGIPDRYHGKTISIKDCYTTSINFTAANDTYIVIAPVPGYAYFTATVATGNTPTAFTGVPYPTFTTNFGNTTAANVQEGTYSAGCQYSAFRYASLAAGLYPTSNYMNFAGSVSVWKADINLGGNFVSVLPNTSLSATNVDSRRLFGAESVGPLAPRDNYSNSFIKGAYSIGFDMSGDFEWQPFAYQSSLYTTNNTTDPNYRTFQESDAAHALPGWGNNETIIIKVTSPAGAVNSAILKTWNCIELKPRTDSGLYQFSHLSPESDPLALEMYSRVKTQLPVAVCAAENEGAWKRVLEAIAAIGGLVGKSMPGPVGWIGSGVQSIANGIAGLVF